MGLLFDGSNDQVTASPFGIPGTVSVMQYLLPLTQGEGNVGTAWKVEGGFLGRWNGTALSKKWQLRSDRSTDGVWDMTTGFATLSLWHGLLATYDTALTTNDPILYTYELETSTFSVLTVGAGLTEVTAPSGSVSEPSTQRFGAAGIFGDDAYDGTIAQVAMWSRILDADEAQLALMRSPLAVPNGLEVYWPMDGIIGGTVRDYSGKGRNGSVSGAVLGSAPPFSSVRPGAALVGA